MTERTILKKSLKMSDDDSVSLNSTQESEAGEERSYVVDRILAEQDDDEGNKYYLIRWEGYGLLASTWEPAENIEGQATIDDWTDEKMRITRGFSKEFDVAAFEEELERLRIAKEARRARRKAKRERLGLAASFSESEEEVPTSAIEQQGTNQKIAGNPSEVLVEPEILNTTSKPKPATRRGRRAVKEKPLKNTITTRVKRRTINLPSQGYISDTSEESPSTEDKEESLDANGKGEKYNTATGKRVRDTLNFVSDEESSSSSGRIPLQSSKKPTQEHGKFEARSRTSYQGTANRASVTVSAASISQVNSPSRGATRGRPRGRARGGGRGNAPTQTRNLSFTKPNTDHKIPPRKRSLANAILNAPNADSNKPTEHFKTPSMVRKAELAARSLADRAPDFQSVGFLSRPSDYGTRSMRKKSQNAREDIEISQSDEVPLILSEDGVKRVPIAEAQDESPALDRTLLPNEAEISERTAKLDLSKSNVGHIDYGQGHPRLFEEATVNPRALVQEGATFVAEHPLNTVPGRSEITTQQLQPTHIEQRGALESQVSLPSGNLSSQQSKPITKINLNEYKARRKSEFLGDAVAVRALFGNHNGTPVLIELTDIEKNLRSYWAPILEGLGVLNFNRSCLAQEFQSQISFLQTRIHTSGSVIINVERATILENIAEQLRPCSGLIFIEKSFGILIFPAKCEEWKFIESSLDVDHGLRYQIFETKFSGSIFNQLNNGSAESIMSSIDPKRQYLDILVEFAQNLRYETLLPSHSDGQDVHNFYLFFPKKAATSAKYIASWLRSCKVDCRIYTNQKSGSWDLFTNNPIFKAGTIIIHESFLPLVSKIPRISSLINGSFHFNFWCMDDGSYSNPFRRDYGTNDILLSYEASMIRLFPHGGAILLTPSFLFSEPERTYDLLKWFHKKVSSSTPGTWRLVLLNNCREFLLDLAIRMTSARKQFALDSSRAQGRNGPHVFAASQLASKQECMAAFRNYTMIDQLLKKGHIAGTPDYWEEDIPDEYESPIVYADQCIGSNDERGLVDWFASWTMLNINLYRKFIVVGTTSSKTRPLHPTKITRQRLLGGRAQVVQVSHDPQATESMGSALKERNRDAFDEAEERSSEGAFSPPSNFAEPVAGESLTAKVLGGGSKLNNPAIDVRSTDLATIHVSTEPRPQLERKHPNSKELRQRTKHGIDESQPQSILEFIAITGRDAGTANRFLSKHNWEVHTAVESYCHSTRLSSPQQLLTIDVASDPEDQSAVVDFIAGTHASAQIAERYLHLAQDDVRRAISLYNESQQNSRSHSGGLSNQEKVGEGRFPDKNDPTKKSEDTSRGHQQYKQAYKLNKPVGDNSHSEVDDMRNSINGSRQSSILQSPALISRKQSIPHDDISLRNAEEELQFDSDFESTVDWYERLKQKGQGWEHIYVGDWESCFQKLLIKN